LLRSEEEWLQVETPGGDVLEDVEHLTPYGFTAAAPAGAEVVVLSPGGSRDAAVVILCGGRTYRLQGLKEGEVAMHSDEGDSVVLRRGRRVEVNTRHFEVSCETCAIKGPGGELLATLAKALDVIAKSMVTTSDGPKPLTPADAALPLLKQILDSFGASP
jgi:phage gp45-like